MQILPEFRTLGVFTAHKTSWKDIIASRCPLTILDEPTTGMDAGVRKDFYRALFKDYIQHPRAVILSSHLLNEIQDVLEDVLLISQGEKRLHLPISDLKE